MQKIIDRHAVQTPKTSHSYYYYEGGNRPRCPTDARNNYNNQHYVRGNRPKCRVHRRMKQIITNIM